MTKEKSIKVGEQWIGIGHPAYLIAEIGSNHNQDKGLALEMIAMAAEAGADAVKFQSIRFDRLYHPSSESKKFRDWFRQIELDEQWYMELAEQAHRMRVDFLSAPTYLEAIDLLEVCNVPAYKLASPQVQGNLEVVRKAARTGKPLFLSTGYCEYGDISRVLKICEEENNQNTVFLHCVSKYPVEMKEANIRFMSSLRAMTGSLVGFSDHSLGHHLPVAAIAMGACVVEKHVTTDRNLLGPDHHFALLMDEFGEMVRQIRDVELAMGSGVRLELLDEEVSLRNKVALKAFSKNAIPAGSSLNGIELNWSRFTGKAVKQEDIAALQRCRTVIDIDPDTPISWDLVELDRDLFANNDPLQEVDKL